MTTKPKPKRVQIEWNTICHFCSTPARHARNGKAVCEAHSTPRNAEEAAKLAAVGPGSVWRDSKGRITRPGDIRAVRVKGSDGSLWDVSKDRPYLIKSATACPTCGSHPTYECQSSKRQFYGCGSYDYSTNSAGLQSDLCRALAEVKRLQEQRDKWRRVATKAVRIIDTDINAPLEQWATEEEIDAVIKEFNRLLGE